MKRIMNALPSVKDMSDVQIIFMKTITEGVVNISSAVQEFYDTIARNVTNETDASKAQGHSKSDSPPASMGSRMLARFRKAAGELEDKVINASFNVAEAVVTEAIPALTPKAFHGYINALQEQSLIPLVDWYRNSAETSWYEMKASIDSRVRSLDSWAPELEKKLRELTKEFEDDKKKGEDENKKSEDQRVNEDEDVFGIFRKAYGAIKKKASDTLSLASDTRDLALKAAREAEAQSSQQTNEEYNSKKQDANEEILAAFTAVIMSEFVFVTFTKLHELIICELAKRMLRKYRGYKLSKLSD